MGEAKRRGTQEQRVEQAVEAKRLKKQQIAERMRQLKQAEENRQHALQDQQRQIANGSNMKAHLALAAALAIGLSAPTPLINRNVKGKP